MSLTSAPLPAIGPDDRRIGPETGLTLVEYGDYDCPFCAAAHSVLSAAVERGEIALVFRHFPFIRKHARAEAAHRGAEAAAMQEKFWPMHELLFTNPGRLEDPDLWRYAGEIGLDITRFDSDRRSELAWERVQEQFMSGIRGGVTATPTIAVAGDGQFSLYAGPLDAATLAEIIDRHR